MVSPVNTSVKHFTSTMPGAPALTGAVGSMVALLDACLVNGFGSKTATSLVVAAGIATMTFAGGASAALVDSVILVAGATPAALNGEQKVLSVSPTAVTFATAAADTTATGTITFKMAGAGWLKPFSDTNIGVYKSADPAGTGCHLRVDDTAAQMSRVVGYETMTGASVGNGPFPTPAQMAGGGYWTKASSGIAAAVAWILVADGRFFTLWVAPYFGSGEAYYNGVTRGFGDFKAFRPLGDAFGCTLTYCPSNNHNDYAGTLDTGQAPHVAARSVSGLGGSTVVQVQPYNGSSVAVSGLDPFYGGFPSSVDGRIMMSARAFRAGTEAPPRGDVPGLYSVPQNNVGSVLSWGMRIAGSGTLAQRNFIVLNPSSSPASPANSVAPGVSLVDITGPWR